MRSLYIPHVADHPNGNSSDPRELALQIVDIVTLRPEIELCYVGIASKCFEILEAKAHAHDNSSTSSAAGGISGHVVSNDGAVGASFPYQPLGGLNAATTTGTNVNLPGTGTANEPLILDEDDDVADEDDDEDDDGLAPGLGMQPDDDVTQSESEDEFQFDDGDSDDEWADGDEASGEGHCASRLRLREILFYDDKVAVFKARHGRL